MKFVIVYSFYNKS